MFYSKNVLVEAVDAETFVEGQNITFVNWGNLKIGKIHQTDGKITSVDATTNLSDTDFKKTIKITWLAEVSFISLFNL